LSILLTHGYFLTDGRNDRQSTRPYPPLGLLYVSAYLKKNNIEHQVFDSTFTFKKDLIDYVKKEKPEIIGFYVNLMTRPKILEIISEIRKDQNTANSKIVLGGPDVTYNIKNYLENGADYLVIGEGEITFFELIKALDDKKNIDTVNGIAYKNANDNIISTPRRQRIKEIDILGFPNLEAIKLQKYFEIWNNRYGYPSLNISTQRGCPYSCNWCSKGVFGTSLVQRSVESVVAEIEYLIKTYNIKYITFVEDLFTIQKEWVKKLCFLVLQKKLTISFECTTRAEHLDEELIYFMKKAGFKQIWIGAENGSQKVIDAMNTKSNLNQINRTMQMLKKVGIRTGTFIMLGYPGETKEDIFQTMKFLKQSNPDNYAISLSYPINGTHFYAEVNFTKVPEWKSSSDRDIDFKRTYNRLFYDFAIRWIVNEFNFYKNVSNGSILHWNTVLYKIKAVTAFLSCQLIIIYQKTW
jgi:anaerobic magnesium-protoporphyrin IX monomethyl ester cyclase